MLNIFEKSNPIPEEICELANKYINKKMKLNLTPATDYIKTEYVALLIAITRLFTSHESIDLECAQLRDEAFNIYSKLVSDILENVVVPATTYIFGMYKPLFTLSLDEIKNVLKVLQERGIYSNLTISTSDPLYGISIGNFEYIRNDLIHELLSRRSSIGECLANKSKKQLSGRTYSINDKPSIRGSDSSEVIREALEHIALELSENLVNRDTLWKELHNRAKSIKNYPFESRGKTIFQIPGKVVWTREKATHHLNTVINWYKTNGHLMPKKTQKTE